MSFIEASWNCNINYAYFNRMEQIDEDHRRFEKNRIRIGWSALESRSLRAVVGGSSHQSLSGSTAFLENSGIYDITSDGVA
jgi:hypothetical protein